MSKYNARKVEIDGYSFSSKIESEYYLYLKEQCKKGQIGDFTTQPRYLLQDKFKKNGKSFRKIEYVADFEVMHRDGSIEVIDIKGFVTETAKLKFKLFERMYNYKLTLLTYVKKHGGWVELEELKRLRKVNK